MPTFYEIRDRRGELRAVHKRVDRPDGSKVISWLGPDGRTGLNGVSTADLPLYGAHLIDTWPEGDPIVLTEGEKAAEALLEIGVPAVATVTGAAGMPSSGTLRELEARIVLLWPDNDAAGLQHMRRIAQALRDYAAVAWVDWAAAPDKGDAADFVAGHGPSDVQGLIATAAADPPDSGASDGEGSERSDRTQGSQPHSSLRSPVSRQPFPDDLADEAFHGLAGEYVRAVAPHTEADPAALLVSFLVAAGSLAGPHVHAIAGDAIHPARLYALVTGDTSKGRKGTSAAPVLSVARRVDPDHVVAPGGLSSGEGLIYHVRDAVEKVKMVGRGKERQPELEVVDEGVEDKRLLIVESEFASVLRVCQRDGNSLTGVLRMAWDAADLRTLTKNQPLVATGAHVSILSHVSREELLRYLDRTDLANGFINRFVIVAARRRHLHPEGGNVPIDALADTARRLREVVTWAAEARIVRRDEPARRLWAEVYARVSGGQPGLLGAATSRAEAQALRLQVAYALLDRSDSIREEHVMASLAVWSYADASVRWVFGDALGDTDADTILRALRMHEHLDRTGISALFGRHRDRSRIERALNLLLERDLVTCEFESTGGRPREVWRVRPA